MPVTDLAATLFVSAAAPESPFGSGSAVAGSDGESAAAGSFAALLENHSIDLKKASEGIDSKNITSAPDGRLSPAAGAGGVLTDARGLVPAVAVGGMPGEALPPVPATSEDLPGEALGPAVDLMDNPAPALALWSLAMPDGKELPQGRQATGDERDSDAPTGDPALAMLPGTALPVVVAAPSIPVEGSGTGALVSMSASGAANGKIASSMAGAAGLAPVSGGEIGGGDADAPTAANPLLPAQGAGSLPASTGAQAGAPAGENLRLQRAPEDGLVLSGRVAARGDADAPTAANPLLPAQGAGSLPASMGAQAGAQAGAPGLSPTAGIAGLPQGASGPDIAPTRFALDGTGSEGTTATRHAAPMPAAGLRPLPDGGGPGSAALPDGLIVASGQTAVARHDAPGPMSRHSLTGAPGPALGNAVQVGEPSPARAASVESAPPGMTLSSAPSEGSAAVSSGPTAPGMRREVPPLPTGGGASPGTANGHTALPAGPTPQAAEAIPLPVRQDLPAAPPLTPPLAPNPGAAAPTPSRSERTRGADALAGPSLAPVPAESIVVNADVTAATGASELGKRQVDSMDAATLLQAPAGREAATTPATHGQASSASPRTLDVPAPAAPPGAPLPMLLAAATGTLGTELGEKILWLSGHNLRGAEIQLDPPELGPLQIQVHSHRDGTSVQFTAHTAVARDALESSLPRLRELLEGSGVPLLDVNVSQQQRQGQRPQDGALAVPPAMRDRLAAAGQGTPDAPRRRPAGLVDAYA